MATSGGYALTIVPDSITATTVGLYAGYDDLAGSVPYKIYASDGTTVVQSGTSPGTSLVTVTGLTPSTEYIAEAGGVAGTRETFTTLSDDPKVATESQWADLASRVKAKADATDVPDVVQTTGTSTTKVMSQNAVTNAVNAIGGTRRATSSGWSTTNPLDYASAFTYADGLPLRGATFPAGDDLGDTPHYVGIGADPAETAVHGAMGFHPYFLETVVLDDGTGTTGVTTGARIALHEEVAAVTGSTAPTTATVGYSIGQLYLDKTTGRTYILTAISNTTPSVYTWQELVTKDYVDSLVGDIESALNVINNGGVES